VGDTGKGNIGEDPRHKGATSSAAKNEGGGAGATLTSRGDGNQKTTPKKIRTVAESPTARKVDGFGWAF